MGKHERSSKSANRPAPYPVLVGSPHHQRSSAHSTPLQSPTLQYAGLPQMSQQHPPQVSRPPPTSYPTSAPYSPAYQYAPQPGPPTHLPRLGSPFPQTPGPSLPSLRSNFPPTHLPPLTSSHEGSPIPGSPIPLPGGPHPGPGVMYHQYYSVPTAGHPQVAAVVSNPPPQRYQLPSNDKVMSGGRHKKEIKRRTKTGCLTCRKRRIKCDEGHPTCHNCAKSKRECLGYDPIFKPQQGPAQPAAIQPAPPPGLAPVPAYGVVLPSIPAYTPRGTSASSPASSCGVGDYPPVDPALDGATSHPQALPPPIMDPNYRVDYNPRPYDRTSPFASAAEGYRHTPHAYPPILPPSDPSVSSNPAKRITIDDLLSRRGSSSGPPLSPPSSERASVLELLEPLKAFYIYQLAPRLDSFFETRWFATTGFQQLSFDPQFAEDMCTVFERLRMRNYTYVDEEDPTIQRRGMPSNLLWAAIRLCFGTKVSNSDGRSHHTAQPALDNKSMEVLRKINIVESLLSGTPDNTPPSPSPVPGSPRDPSSENYFWDLLEDITRIQPTDADRERELELLFNKSEHAAAHRDHRRVLAWIAEVSKAGAVEKGATLARPAVIRNHLENIAGDRTRPQLLEIRICGRAIGLWTEPILDSPWIERRE
ncbi:hypothetical protein EX30DRAFT_199319 [Ascodesmis nigricans]|uniref:Zn(2)-C6 fungal-type domain-containing protein n=1 Tax=Ascodesmis nigricans TaxID=341454 RepID=A0A4V3SHU0_9PEZI|nr:hypothetical protein EX30DRAFT_199319 [Ascodesmis nigricans]